MTKEKSIDIATQAGIVERGMGAYKAAKARGWVGLSDERLMEIPKQEQDEPDWYHVECDNPDYSGFFKSKADAETQVNEHGGYVTEFYTKPQQRKPLTDEQKAKVARMFSDRISNECNINADDHWKYHSESVLDDINFILQAAQEIKE